MVQKQSHSRSGRRDYQKSPDPLMVRRRGSCLQLVPDCSASPEESHTICCHIKAQQDLDFRQDFPPSLLHMPSKGLILADKCWTQTTDVQTEGFVHASRKSQGSIGVLDYLLDRDLRTIAVTNTVQSLPHHFHGNT